MMLSQQAATAASNASPIGIQPPDMPSPPSPDNSGFTTPVDNQPTAISPAPWPASALLVSNLPSVLFSQADDLHPLLCPFGEIVHLEIRPNREVGNISVFVEYKTAVQAREARDALHGQCYTNQPVKVEFVQPTSPDINYWPLCKINTKAGLNPMAAPFLAQWKYNPDDLDAALSNYSTSLSSDDGYMKQVRTPMEAQGFFTNNTIGLARQHGSHSITHRPHSAPSKYV